MSKPEEIKMSNNKKLDVDKNQYDTPNTNSTKRNHEQWCLIEDKSVKRPNKGQISLRESNTSAGAKEVINEELTATINAILITHLTELRELM